MVEPRHLAIARRARFAMAETKPSQGAASVSIARRSHPPPGALPIAALASLTSPAIVVIAMVVAREMELDEALCFAEGLEERSGRFPTSSTT